MFSAFGVIHVVQDVDGISQPHSPFISSETETYFTLYIVEPNYFLLKFQNTFLAQSRSILLSDITGVRTNSGHMIVASNSKLQVDIFQNRLQLKCLKKELYDSSILLQSR